LFNFSNIESIVVRGLLAANFIVSILFSFSGLKEIGFTSSSIDSSTS